MFVLQYVFMNDIMGWSDNSIIYGSWIMQVKFDFFKYTHLYICVFLGYNDIYRYTGYWIIVTEVYNIHGHIWGIIQHNIPCIPYPSVLSLSPSVIYCILCSFHSNILTYIFMKIFVIGVGFINKFKVPNVFCCCVLNFMLREILSRDKITYIYFQQMFFFSNHSGKNVYISVIKWTVPCEYFLLHYSVSNIHMHIIMTSMFGCSTESSMTMKTLWSYWS